MPEPDEPMPALIRPYMYRRDVPRVKAAKPCGNPWCRGAAGDCGRTPQEHLEDGMSVTQFLEGSPTERVDDLGWRNLPRGEDEGVVRAPFTDDQVASLNAYQRSGVVRPYTCGVDSSHGYLVAYAQGWKCLHAVDPGIDPTRTCDYVQDFAHTYTATWAWRTIELARLPNINGRWPDAADLVEMWHTLPADHPDAHLPLHAFLGMSWDRYKRWVHGDAE